MVAASLAACGRDGSTPSPKPFESKGLTAEFAITYDLRFTLEGSTDINQAGMRTFHFDGATKLDIALGNSSGGTTRSSWMLKSDGTEIVCGADAIQATNTICRQSGEPPRADRRFLGVSEVSSEGSTVKRMRTDTIAGRAVTCFDMKPARTHGDWSQCFDEDGARLSVSGGGASLLLGFLLNKLQAFGFDVSVSGPIAVDSVALTAIERREPTVDDFTTDGPITTALVGCKLGENDAARDVTEACAHSLVALPFQLPTNLAGYREPEIDVARDATGDHVKVIFADRSGQNLITLEAEALRPEGAPKTSVMPVMVGLHPVRFASSDRGRSATWDEDTVEYRLSAKDPALDLTAIDARLRYVIEHMP